MIHRHELYAVAWSFAAVAVLLAILLYLTSPTITGKVTATSVNILPLKEYNCSVTLAAGWNLISIFCIQGDEITPEQALSSMSTIPYYVFGHTLTSDTWKVYVNRIPASFADLPSYAIDDLSVMKRTQGFWVYVDSATIITYNGALRNNVVLPLQEGWNLIGYPTNISKNISEALSSIDGSYSEVWQYNASNQTWSSYRPDTPNSTLQEMAPGYGYWINMTAAATWVVDW
ncbi:MAG: hypothetical protein V1725_03595 [archaeon]